MSDWQFKLRQLEALNITEEVTSSGYKSVKVCGQQANYLVSAFSQVGLFLRSLERSLGTIDLQYRGLDPFVWDELIGALTKGFELLDSCRSDDWVMRSLLCRDSREDFEDVHADLLVSVELVGVWLIRSIPDLEEKVIAEALRQCLDHLRVCKTSSYSSAADLDRADLLSKARKGLTNSRLSLSRLWRQDRQALELLNNALLQMNMNGTSTSDHEALAIDRSEIKFQDHIAQGGFGTIYQGVWLRKVFAVKVFPPGDTSFPRELAVLSTHKHPNIVQIVGHTFDKTRQQYSLVMEKMDMDLAAYLKSKSGILVPLSLLSILHKIGKAMAWLHSKEVIHRDLKPENVLVRLHPSSSSISESDEQRLLVIKVSDFGLARTNFMTSRISGATLRRGTKVYMAPEVWSSDHYSKKADVYSFGVLAYQLTTGKVPFHDISKRNDFMEMVCAGSRPQIPAYLDLEVAELMKSCWHQNPEERPSMSDLCERLVGLKNAILIRGRHSGYYLRRSP